MCVGMVWSVECWTWSGTGTGTGPGTGTGTGAGAGTGTGGVPAEASDVATAGAADSALPGEAEGVRLWVVRDDVLEPVLPGRPPAEFLAGYGDTVLPRPPPADAAPTASTPGAEHPRSAMGSVGSPRSAAAPPGGGGIRAGGAMPTAVSVPAAANGTPQPESQGRGFWTRVFGSGGSDSGGASTTVVTEPLPPAAAEPAGEAAAAASEPAADDVVKQWALPTIGSVGSPPPPASDDALHSTDGYAELTALDQSHATRDAAISAARVSNLAFRQKVVDEEDDEQLLELIADDLAKFRRGESPNL